MHTITLGDLIIRDSDGSRIVAFDRQSEMPVHIKDAKNGKACGCICACGRPMIAYQGRNKHRFQHEASVDGRTCQVSGETALHQFAKNLLQNRLEIQIPALTESDGRNQIRVTEAKVISFERAVLEKKEGEIVPDVICFTKGRRLQIEFAVTHFSDEEKKRKIKELDIASIEIDLSNFKNTALEELDDIILFSANREWLHNPKSKYAIAKLHDREVERQKGNRQRANSLIEIVKSLKENPPVKHSEWFEKALQNGIFTALDEAEKISPGFLVPDGDWKACLLLELGISRTDGFTDKEAFGRIRDKGWIHKDFRFVEDEISELVKQGGLPTFLSPWQSVTGFIAAMTGRGFLIKGQSWTYFGGRVLYATLEKAKRRRELPAIRRKELADTVNDILQKARFEEHKSFLFESWLPQYAKRANFELADVWLADEDSWGQFCYPLSILLAEVRSPLRTITDTYGLPISAERERRIAAQEEDELQRKNEAKRRDDELADKRARELETRKQEEITRQAETARIWLEKLRPIAVRSFQNNEEKANLWLNSGNPKLGGKRPKDHCVDKVAFSACETILKGLGRAK